MLSSFNHGGESLLLTLHLYAQHFSGRGSDRGMLRYGSLPHGCVQSRGELKCIHLQRPRLSLHSGASKRGATPILRHRLRERLFCFSPPSGENTESVDSRGRSLQLTAAASSSFGAESFVWLRDNRAGAAADTVDPPAGGHQSSAGLGWILMLLSFCVRIRWTNTRGGSQFGNVKIFLFKIL